MKGPRRKRREERAEIVRRPIHRLQCEYRIPVYGKEHVFASPLGDQPMDRKAMSEALRGTKRSGGKVRRTGICDLLGLKPFTPHDLRRTAATLAGDLGFDDS